MECLEWCLQQSSSNVSAASAAHGEEIPEEVPVAGPAFIV
jgi:hypothetical protein